MALHLKHKFSSPLYVTKRMGFSKKKYWLIRAGGILVAFLVAGIVCTILAPGSFGTFYVELGRGCFDFTDISSIIDLLVNFSILLLIATILTPAFKMRFWNIGAEGQILIGCLAAAGVAKFMPRSVDNGVVLFICFFAAVGASTTWSLVPAIFKAFFNTNETLFTLMLNYVAAISSSMAISLWIKNGSQSFGVLSNGVMPAIFNNTGTLVVFYALLIFIGMYLYIERSKHGYELSVLGQSVETARYIGINVKAVTIRTMAISGILFGAVAFFLVCGVHQTFSATLVGGKGFTGVLIAWLGHFHPLEIALFSFLAAVMERGTTTAASAVNISSAQFSAICTGAFFFIIIACEFFSQYKIRIHHEKKQETEAKQ